MEYKGMRLDKEIGELIRYMPQVDDFRETLTKLQAVWDNLALLGQLSGVGNEMGNTREAFFELSQSLINHLGREHWQRVQDSLTMKASVAVEMLLRNLFERTADIGFLATDETIAQFMKHFPPLKKRYGKQVREERAARYLRMQQHLEAYVAKYSVYNNVILLSPDGEVVFQLVDNGVEVSRDPLIQEALSTQAAYVEVFRATDILPNVKQPHIYAYRIVDANDQALGVLCLCFNFQDECQRIFAELDDGDWSVMTLTDAQGVVIASSDDVQVPIGCQLQASSQQVTIQRFAGHKYLSVTMAGKGYQGYLGQGWKGQVMVPLIYAFDGAANTTITLPSLQGLEIFSEELMSIPVNADRIQTSLNRSVWNGSIKQARKTDDSVFGRALLWEVSQTGLKTKAIFSSAIQNLYQTVIGATLANNRFLASLAINIMDRNLYERANDCRWWALTDAFRQALSAPVIDTNTQQQLSKILSYINQLYTVYTGMVLYDKQGQIIAVSATNLSSWVGKQLDAPWVAKSLSLHDSQDYVVSDFAPSPLYNNQATYIYAAAVMHLDHPQQAVGGIGIVFDSTPQFSAMLSDAAPDGHGHESFAVFYNEKQQIIATTHPQLTIGATMPIDMRVAQTQGSDIVSCALGRYAVGSVCASGYREYAAAQGHRVHAAIFSRIGALCENEVVIKSLAYSPMVMTEMPGAQLSLASFMLAGQLFSVSSDAVVESVSIAEMSYSAAVGNSLFSGYVTYQQRAVPVLSLADYLGLENSVPQQIIIVESQGMRFGILVDRLDQVFNLSESLLSAVPVKMGRSLVESLITLPTTPEQMMMLLSVDKLAQAIRDGREGLAALQSVGASLVDETMALID